jgi:hypothetical protein
MRPFTQLPKWMKKNLKMLNLTRDKKRRKKKKQKRKKLLRATPSIKIKLCSPGQSSDQSSKKRSKMKTNSHKPLKVRAY